jgi:hypothetical protein
MRFLRLPTFNAGQLSASVITRAVDIFREPYSTQAESTGEAAAAEAAAGGSSRTAVSKLAGRTRIAETYPVRATPSSRRSPTTHA